MIPSITGNSTTQENAFMTVYNSQEKLSDRPQELKSGASVIAKKELNYRQNHRSSFKSDPRWVVSPGMRNIPGLPLSFC